MGSKAARRVWVIEEGYDPETGEPSGTYDRQAAAELLADLEGTLARVGGMVNMTVRRVQIGEAMGEPVAEARELVVTWDSFTPLERLEGEGEEDGPEQDAPAPDEEHPLVAGDDDDTRTAAEIAAEFGEEPVTEVA